MSCRRACSYDESTTIKDINSRKSQLLGRGLRCPETSESIDLVIPLIAAASAEIFSRQRECTLKLDHFDVLLHESNRKVSTSRIRINGLGYKGI